VNDSPKRSRYRVWLLILTSLILVYIVGHQYVFFWNDEDFLDSSVLPHTAQQINQKFPNLVPPTATTVYYYYHSPGFRSLDFYFCFHIPPEDVSAAMSFLMAKAPTDAAKANTPILGPEPLPGGPAFWWKVHTIKHGFAGPSFGSYNSPLIWYDSDTSIMYVHKMD
jgi:hypothetical protein